MRQALCVVVLAVAAALLSGCRAQAAPAAGPPAPPGVAAQPVAQRAVGEPAFVDSVSLSRDGRLVAAVGEDAGGLDALRLWDAATGEVLGTLARGPAPLDAVAFVDARVLVQLGGDPRGLEQVVALSGDALGGYGWGPQSDDDAATRVVVSPDGRWAAVSHYDGMLRVWPLAGDLTLDDAWSAPAHQGAARALAFSPDSRQLASGGDDGLVKLWDATDGTALRTLDGHASTVTALAWAPDGATLYSGSDALALANDDLGKPPGTALVNGKHLVAPHPEARTLVAWDPATGTTRLSTSLDHVDTIDALCVTDDGTRLVAAVYRNGRGGGSVEVIDPDSATVVESHLEEVTGAFSSMACGADGTVVVGDLDGVTVLDLASGTVRWTARF